uniref:Uncharacterized protein n=1 Tax=Arundo donax TaxID=35708 RepID=A0A0A9BMW4_ARUDO
MKSLSSTSHASPVICIICFLVGNTIHAWYFCIRYSLLQLVIF